jgi:hypothetical protein
MPQIAWELSLVMAFRVCNEGIIGAAEKVTLATNPQKQ